MITCTKCKVSKERSAYNTHISRKSGIESQCKACKSAYYQANKAVLSENAKKAYQKTKMRYFMKGEEVSLAAAAQRIDIQTPFGTMENVTVNGHKTFYADQTFVITTSIFMGIETASINGCVLVDDEGDSERYDLIRDAVEQFNYCRKACGLPPVPTENIHIIRQGAPIKTEVA